MSDLSTFRLKMKKIITGAVITVIITCTLIDPSMLGYQYIYRFGLNKK